MDRDDIGKTKEQWSLRRNEMGGEAIDGTEKEEE